MNITDTLTTTDIEFYYASRVPTLPQRGSQWRGACPLHHGDRESFSVNAATGLWRCHSTCSTGGDIIQLEMRLHECDTATAIKSIETILGVPLGAQKTDKAKRPESKIIAVYSYLSEKGQLVFQVLRKELTDGEKTWKGFSQRRPDPNGEKKWVYNLKEFEGKDYVLPAVQPIPYNLNLLKKAQNIVIVEGEKDADNLRELGFVATCNPGGVTHWKPEFAGYFAGKRVVIIPDRDEYVPGRPEAGQFPGQKHALEVARSLLGVTASLKLVELDQKDASDYIENGGTAETLRAAIAAAVVADEATLADYERRWSVGVRNEIEKPVDLKAPEVVRSLPAPEGEEMSPNDIARTILSERSIITDSSDAVYEYNGITWKDIRPKMLETYAMKKDVHGPTKRTRRSEAADYVQTATRTSWVPWRSIQDYEVPMLNGVVDLRDSTVRPHREHDYLETTLPHNFDPGAKCPVWLKALQVWFGKDEDYLVKVAALQEFMGYAVMAHAKYKKALVLFGKPDSGKSQIESTMRRMVGEHNTTSISVEDMNDPKKLAPIKGKMLNTISELRSDALIADGGFKRMISTGDPVQLDQKYKAQETYVPFAKHVIVGNLIPAVNDLTAATHNRLLIISFNHEIAPEQRDVRLIDKLTAEMNGIVSWALHGAARIYAASGQFTRIPESEKIIEEHRRGQNAINDFLSECCVPSDDALIRVSEMRERFSKWNGRPVLSARVNTLLKSARMEIVLIRESEAKPEYRALRGWSWK